jgi:hypothetical protein
MSSKKYLVIICILLSSGVGIQPAVGEDFEELYLNSEHGYEQKDVRAAFSLDPDDASDGNTQAIDSIDEAMWFTDRSYRTPPNKYRDWNEWEIENFTTGGEDKSKYPTAAETRSGRWIKKAHATKFHQTNSVYVRWNETNTLHYSNPNNRVYGIVDYRIRPPSSDTDGSDGTKVLRTMESHNIKSVCIIRSVDKDTIQSVNNICKDESYEWAVLGKETNDKSHPSISVSNTPSKGGKVRYNLVAVIEATVKVETKEEQKKTVCDPDDSTDCETTYEWVTTDISSVTNTVSVSDGWKSHVYDTNQIVISNTTNAGSQYRSNQSEVYVQTDGLPFAGFSINNTQVSSSWRFYTRRDTEWDEIWKHDGVSKTVTSQYDTVPIKTYAYPSSVGPTVAANSSDSAITISDKTKLRNQSSPIENINDDVDVSAGNIDGNFNIYEGIGVRTGNENLSDITVHSIVPNQNISITTATRFEVSRLGSNLTVETVETNDTHVHLDITLQDENGNPIDLSSSDNGGEIIINNQTTVITNATGEASIFYNGSKSGTVTYRPEGWYGQKVAYKSDWARYRTAPDGIQWLYTWILELFIILSPFLIALWLADKLPAITTWPPWKVI